LLKVDYFESESNKNAKKEEKNDDFRYREQTSISSSKSSSKDIKRDARAREESASPPHTLSQHEIQKRFDHIWNKYPYKSHRLTGKGKVSAANKLRIVSLESKGNQITKAMKNYKLDCEINDWREKLSACSFFGEHYVRFLDENWEEPKPERRKKQNGFKNFTERSMDAHDRHVQEHGYRNLEHALLETSR